MSERTDEARRKSEERIEDLTRCYRMASGGADPSPELVAAWRATPRRFTDKDPDEVISRLVVEGADKDIRIAALEAEVARLTQDNTQMLEALEKARKLEDRIDAAIDAARAQRGEAHRKLRAAARAQRGEGAPDA